MPPITIQMSADPVIAGLIGLLLVIVVAIPYRRHLRAGAVLTAAACRVCASLTLLLLFLDASCTKTIEVSSDATMVLVSDHSTSMLGEADSVSGASLESVRDAAVGRLKSVPGIDRITEIRFASQPWLPESDERPDVNSTDLVAAIASIRQLVNLEDVGAVVLLTDGRSTDGTSLSTSIVSTGTPIYVPRLGDLVERELIIRSVESRPSGTVGSAQEIDVHLKISGGSSCSVEAFDDAGWSARKPIAGRSVRFSYRPSRSGLRRITVRLFDEGRLPVDQRTVSIDIKQRRHRLLLLSDGFHPDLGFVRAILERRTDLELVSASIDEDRTDAARREFDVIVVVGSGGAGSSSIAVRTVSDRLRQFPILIVSGSTPSRFIGSLVAIRFGSVRFPEPHRPSSVNVSLTSTGSSHELFSRFSADLFGRSSSLTVPTIAVDSADPHVLATGATIHGQTQPVIVVRERPARSILIAASDLWRWSLTDDGRLESQGRAPENALDDLLHVAVEWLLESPEPSRLRTTRPTYLVGEEVGFEVEAGDSTTAALFESHPGVIIERNNRTSDTVALVRTGTDRFIARLRAQDTGRFEARLSTDRSRQQQPSVAYTVLPTTPEVALQGVDLDRLAGPASRSGGLVGSIDDVIDSVRNLQAFVEGVTHTRQQTVHLRDPPIGILIVILLLTAEWVLRWYYRSYFRPKSET